MPFLLLLLLVGGAAALAVSSGGGASSSKGSLLLKSHVQALPSLGTGLDAGLSPDQATAIRTAAAHETRADKLEDFANSLPAGMPIASALLLQAAHTRAISGISASSRSIPGMVGP